MGSKTIETITSLFETGVIPATEPVAQEQVADIIFASALEWCSTVETVVVCIALNALLL